MATATPRLCESVAACPAINLQCRPPSGGYRLRCELGVCGLQSRPLVNRDPQTESDMTRMDKDFPADRTGRDCELDVKIESGKL